MRARATARALTERTTEILSVVEQEGRLAVAFQITATHSGPLASPLGDIAPTGKRVTTQVIDVLHLENGRIHELWMVADTFGQLLQLGAVQLTD
jgi:predicted ester cyclase